MRQPHNRTDDGQAVVNERLAAQQLDGAAAATPDDVVRRLLAVQAQDFEPACWSVAMRTPGATAQEVFAAFDAGRFVRTHVLRPTWHFVHPDDLGWLLALTAPRVHVVNGSMYRSLGLDAATLARATDVLVAALADACLTRAELAAALGRAGIEASGPRLAYIVMHAELEQVVCSGPRRGRQQTYARFDRRCRPARVADREEALGNLAVRFFAGHGPGTDRDLKGWASLTVADARTAIAAAGERLETVEADGLTLHRAPQAPTAARSAPRVHLLQAYDEYISGFPHSRALVDATGQASGASRRLPGDVLVDGYLAGTWRRSLARRAVTIAVATPGPLDPPLREALVDAAERYAAFHQLPAQLVAAEGVDGRIRSAAARDASPTGPAATPARRGGRRSRSRSARRWAG